MNDRAEIFWGKAITKHPILFMLKLYCYIVFRIMGISISKIKWAVLKERMDAEDTFNFTYEIQIKFK
jgi:hypothetical protein